MIYNCQNLAEETLKLLKKNKRNISLAVVQIGDDKISKIFIEKKRKTAKEIGISFNYYNFSENITFEKLKEEISKIKDNGIIIQLPIKGSLSKKTQQILNLVPLQKDVDVLSEDSLGKLFSGTIDILPPVVGAIDKILKKNKINSKGKNVCIIGPGRLVGKPSISYFISAGATVFTVNRFTKNTKKITKDADIIITGVGKPDILSLDMIKKGVIIIDAGVCEKDGKVSGDVDAKKLGKKAGLVTPVPGGVGPLTVVSLLENLTKRNNGFSDN